MASVDSLCPPSMVNSARAGDLRAIAAWLNSWLIPQGVYARVGVAKPGCFRITVEFERSPERDRLTRFICHRLCKLNSSLIKSVQIVAQWAKTSEVAWVQSVRINTAASHTAQRSLPLLTAARPTAKLSRAAKPKHRQVLSSPSTSRPMSGASRAISQQIRAKSLLLTGSAAAAFLVGCGVEVLIAHTGALASQSEADAVNVSQPASQRADTVKTAQDQVTVVQQPVLNPDDPTVTLTFGDDAALGTIEAMPIQVSSAMERRPSDVAATHLDAPLIQVQPDSLEEESAPEQLQALIDNRIDVVSLASDRLMEAGTAGLEETLESLKQVGIHSVGAGDNRREASRPEILDVKGQRIAYLGYSDSDLNAARNRASGVNSKPDERVAADIQAIRNQVDWVVVNYHWSKDLEAYPTNWQIDLAHLAIDQGADLVVGYHPNVLQGAEIYKGRAIAYSLGNFIFGENSESHETSADDYDTAVLKVSLRNDQMRLEFLPVEVRQASPEVLEGAKADQILQYMQQASSLFTQPMQSPVVLDKRSPATPPEILPAPSDQPAAPFEQPTAPSNSAPAQPSDPFITAPDGTNGMQPETSPVDPSAPFITYPESSQDETETSSESDFSNEMQPQTEAEFHWNTDGISEPFHSSPDAQAPDAQADEAAEINAVQSEPPDAAASIHLNTSTENLPSSVEVEPEQSQPEQSQAMLPTVSETVPAQLSIPKSQAATSEAEPNVKPASLGELPQ